MIQPLLLTMGDPTGIGPELIVKALLEDQLSAIGRPLQVVGDLAVLHKAAAVFGKQFQVIDSNNDLYTLAIDDRRLQLIAISTLAPESLGYGQPDHSCGRAMAEYIEYAIARCQDSSASGMVTAPINKAAINAAGFHFPGHTELLAARCKVDKVVMMLAGTSLKVCLVTTHAPYLKVPELLTVDAILSTLRITDAALRHDFAVPKPRLAVLALNPHAGEGGLFGDEEQRIIVPAITAAKAEGIDASGPHSADTLFHFAVRGAYDAVICMYHDQGLIPLKLLHFDDAVNVTLGLPMIRTSVDHGTAYDLAGSGKASTASLCAAIEMAAQMAHSRTSLSLE